jgi:hypothetical protein
VDVRVAFAKALEVRDQPAHAKTRLSGYLQYLGLLAVGEHVAAGHVDLGEDLVDLGQVQAASGRELQAPADAQEQVVAQHLFKLRHLLADRALGQVQFFGGTGKAQVRAAASKHCRAVMEGTRRLDIAVSAAQSLPDGMICGIKVVCCTGVIGLILIHIIFPPHHPM